MSKRKYRRVAAPHEHGMLQAPLHSRVPNLGLALPTIGGLWEKNDTHWNYEVAISEYAPEPPNRPQVKFYPLPSEWIPWDELHKNYCYIGKTTHDLELMMVM